MASRLALLALTLLPFAPAASWAQTTPESAQALEQQLHDWVTQTLGPDAKIAKRPVRITPTGDHYAVAVPFGDAPDAPQVTADARMTDGGRWSIDNIRAPSPAEFNVTLPVPKQGGGAGVMGGAIHYRMTLGQQAGQILFDPSYATASTLNSTLQNLDLQAAGPQLKQSSHLDRGTTTTIVRPASGGRVDMVTDSTFEGYQIDSAVEGAEPIKLGMGRVRFNGEIDSISRDRAVQVLQAAVQLGAAMQASGGAAPPKLDPKVAATLLDAMADVASGMQFDESVERLSVSYGDTSGTLRTVQLGLAAKSDAGLLQAQMNLGAEGLAIPDLPLGPMAELIPTKVSIRPAVSGVPVADLLRLAKASDGGASPSAADIQGLFSHGGITAGLDSFSVDVGGAGFTGMGKLLFTSPDQFTGTAQVTATNLDLLQQRIATHPELAQAAPVIIFLKGIGRTVENRMVWDVTYRGNHLLVNNQDLSAMMGGPPGEQGGPKAAPRSQTRPNRNRP